MSVWFTSDIHFGHTNIISFCNRPFDSVAEMDEAIVEQWNSQVAPDDTVWVVGDACMGHRAETLQLVDRCVGYKLLCPGNHDHVFSEHPERVRDRWLPEYRKRFDLVAERARIEDMHSDVVNVCHFPYAPAGAYDDRYADHHPTDDGRWLIHGHVHDTWRQRGRQINVGLDAWGGRLVSIDEIQELIDAGPNDLAHISWER